MAILISTFYPAFLLTWISGAFSLLSGHPSNFSDYSRRTYQPAAVDWRSKALDRYNEADNSTLNRRECWIMKMGREDDNGQDVVKCTDKMAPSLRQLIQHGRNGTEFGKADKHHTPVFYTGYTAAGMVAGGAPAGVNPSLAVLWFIKRALNGYQKCEGALVLNQKIYTYSDMARASWYSTQFGEMTIFSDDYPEYTNTKYDTDPLMTLTWCYCQALARAAMPDSGEAWLAMPWDMDDWSWLPLSNWNLNELPGLTQNLHINKVSRFDPLYYSFNPDRVPPSEKGQGLKSQPRILWDRSNPNHRTFDQDWICPISG